MGKEIFIRECFILKEVIIWVYCNYNCIIDVIIYVIVLIFYF